MISIAVFQVIRVVGKLLPHHFFRVVMLSLGHIAHWAHSAVHVGAGSVTIAFEHGWFWEVLGLLLVLWGVYEIVFLFSVAAFNLKKHKTALRHAMTLADRMVPVVRSKQEEE